MCHTLRLRASGHGNLSVMAKNGQTPLCLRVKREEALIGGCALIGEFTVYVILSLYSVGTQLSQASGPNLHADCKELGTQPSQRQVLTNQHRLFMGVATNFLGPNG